MLPNRRMRRHCAQFINSYAHVKSCRAGYFNHTLHYAIHDQKYALLAHYWAIGDGTTLAIQFSGVMSSGRQLSLSA
jgi:hypothetical protein